jgi:hypothetical protein
MSSKTKALFIIKRWTKALASKLLGRTKDPKSVKAHGE